VRHAAITGPLRQHARRGHATGGRAPALIRLLLALTGSIALIGTAVAGVPALAPATREAPAAPLPARPAATAAATATDAAAADAAALTEVEVVGEQPGPGLWKVTKGDHVLWLLGTLDHVPRRMQWHSRAVESALDQSQELLTSAPAVSARIGPVMLLRLYLQWRGMQKDPDRTRLRDWLSAPLYARFEALKARYDAHDTRIEELRPPFAALRLYQRTLDAAGLTRSDQIERSVIELARRRHVPIERPRLQVDDPLGTLKQVRSLSPAVEVGCLASTITRLETDLPLMQQRARAWAVGDVQRLRALPYPDQREVCITDLSAAPTVRTLVDDASRAWINAAEAALNTHRVSFGLQPIYQLLAAGGPLARFRAEGYQVRSPD
jgi:uncharacterized protein YbaP (TraB family)